MRTRCSFRRTSRMGRSRRQSRDEVPLTHMNSDLLEHLREAHENRRACVLVTVAATRGSVPREAGAKMLVYADGKAAGTIGGGKFESLVIADSLAALPGGAPVLKVYPL